MIANRSTKKVNALTFIQIEKNIFLKNHHMVEKFYKLGRTRNVKSVSFQERIRDFTFYKKISNVTTYEKSIEDIVPVIMKYLKTKYIFP